jgi:hypothetical protein
VRWGTSEEDSRYLLNGRLGHGAGFWLLDRPGLRGILQVCASSSEEQWFVAKVRQGKVGPARKYGCERGNLHRHVRLALRSLERPVLPIGSSREGLSPVLRQ